MFFGIVVYFRLTGSRFKRSLKVESILEPLAHWNLDGYAAPPQESPSEQVALADAEKQLTIDRFYASANNDHTIPDID